MFIELIQGQRHDDPIILVRIEAIVAVKDYANRRNCLVQVVGAEPYVSLETADAFLARLKEVDRNE